MIETDAVYMLIREAMLLALVAALPVLGAALGAALLAALFQTLFRMSETTLAIVPRLIAGVTMLIVAGPWIASRVTAFAERTWSLLQSVHL